jgi:hypothetical protein
MKRCARFVGSTSVRVGVSSNSWIGGSLLPTIRDASGSRWQVL